MVSFDWMKTLCAVAAAFSFIWAAIGAFFRRTLFVSQKKWIHAQFFFFPRHILSALIGICGACLERARCVLLFAILYLLSTIANVVFFLISIATWEEVQVNGSAVVGTLIDLGTLIYMATLSYLALCLFSLYIQLKNKKRDVRDAELAS